MADLNVRFNPERSRWEALVDGDEVGFLDYQVNCGVVEISGIGVEVAPDDEASARVVTTALVRAGLEQAHDDGLQVLATSPVVDDHLEEGRRFLAELGKDPSR